VGFFLHQALAKIEKNEYSLIPFALARELEELEQF